MQIDLNSDLGEAYGPWTMGPDAELLSLVTSANVACGGHAGDPETMYRTLCLARARGVTVGAHPGYADPLGFGRRVIPMAPAEITRMVAAQIGALQGIARLAGTRVAYVKAHGALANLAAESAEVAEALVAALPPDLPLLAISGTEQEKAARRAGHKVFSEIFADRAYLPDGRLVPRSRSDAMLHGAAAVDRLLGFLKTGLMPTTEAPIRLQAQSICIHGDSPEALDLARALRARLMAEGVTLAPFA
ncbi:LamB/YcsF family protein [Stagnihabitans tardus]|uniref:5-oxoprolinase subunit PxpA n=1 Tax=Stagnihabitans tardus TaxID=2699202 RepID=A0AAE4YAC1_9RHOB|nr:5-oxoprolinase subunit PxpA [Stagnihabitans tardus]NBZ88022.1 5-oxoprolinase subunit PxpA [Stagnihabitans tardus]